MSLYRFVGTDGFEAWLPLPGEIAIFPIVKLQRPIIHRGFGNVPKGTKLQGVSKREFIRCEREDGEVYFSESCSYYWPDNPSLKPLDRE